MNVNDAFGHRDLESDSWQKAVRSGGTPKITQVFSISTVGCSDYPLVNVYITMGEHHFSWENPLSIAIFNSYVTNYQRVICLPTKVDDCATG